MWEGLQFKTHIKHINGKLHQQKNLNKTQFIATISLMFNGYRSIALMIIHWLNFYYWKYGIYNV